MASHFYNNTYVEEFCIPNCDNKENKDLCIHNCLYNYSYEEYKQEKHNFYLKVLYIGLIVGVFSFILGYLVESFRSRRRTQANQPHANAQAQALAVAHALPHHQAQVINQVHAHAHAHAQLQWPIVGYVIEIPDQQQEQDQFFDEGIEI
jgi:hypothetical protein